MISMVINKYVFVFYISNYFLTISKYFPIFYDAQMVTLGPMCGWETYSYAVNTGTQHYY